MGRPLKRKKYFGTSNPATALNPIAKLPGADEGVAVINFQVTDTSYNVTVNGVTGVCYLADGSTPLVDNKMALQLKKSTGAIVYATKIAAHRVTLSDGTNWPWDVVAATTTVLQADVQGTPLSPVIAISAQPTSTSVVAAATATFSVTATTSTGTLTYQWYSRTSSTVPWVAVSSGGTSASLSVTGTIVGMTGTQYYCKVGVSGKNVYKDSNTATLTVTAS